MSRRIDPLITEEQIKVRVKELGKQISDDYRGKDKYLKDAKFIVKKDMQHRDRMVFIHNFE